MFVNITIRSLCGWRGSPSSACVQPLAGRAAGVDQHLQVERIHRLHRRARLASAEIERRRMAVDVDDRKLRPRHRMLRHDERGPRLVLADARRRELGLRGLPPGAAGSGPAAAAARRRRQRRPRQRREDAMPERVMRRIGVEEVSQPAVSRILFAFARVAPCGASHERRTTIIPLGPPLLAGSSDLPGGFGRAVLRSGPPYLVLLRAGFCLPPCYHRRGALLPHLFTLTRLRRGLSAAGFGEAVCFLCHFPSGCPDRALPGALPCGVRTFLSPCGAAIARLTATAISLGRTATLDYCGSAVSMAPGLQPGAFSDASLDQPVGRHGRRRSALPVRLLRDLVLLELLVEVAARRVDDFGGLRDVPAVLAQLGDQVRALGVSLNSRSVPRLRRRRIRAPASARRRPPTRRDAGERTTPGRSATSIVSPPVMMISRSTVLRSSRMLPFQR